MPPHTISIVAMVVRKISATEAHAVANEKPSDWFGPESTRC